jgi:hypothetical protein
MSLAQVLCRLTAVMPVHSADLTQSYRMVVSLVEYSALCVERIIVTTCPLNVSRLVSVALQPLAVQVVVFEVKPMVHGDNGTWVLLTSVNTVCLIV